MNLKRPFRIFLILAATPLEAYKKGENQKSTNINLNFKKKHIWRGIIFEGVNFHGRTPSCKSYLGFTVKENYLGSAVLWYNQTDK